ncbi:MAG: hypothetical protein ACREJ2_04535, partial [Planctomycetota bacterium]
ALTILFEIAVILILVVYLLGRISTNEDSLWASRVQMAQGLAKDALADEQARLDRLPASPALPEGGTNDATGATAAADRVHFEPAPDPALFAVRLNALLDLQAQLATPSAAPGKAALAAAAQAIDPSLHGENAFKAAIARLEKTLAAPAPLTPAQIDPLLRCEAPVFERLPGLLNGAARAGIADWEYTDAAQFQQRRDALGALLVVLHAAAQRQPAADADAGTAARELRAAAAARDAIPPLTLAYLHGALSLDPSDDSLLTPAQAINLYLRLLNRELIAFADADAATAAGHRRALMGAEWVEAGLPSASDLVDRLAAQLIENHLALWHRGVSTPLWNDSKSPAMVRWSGGGQIETAYQSLLLLSRNLRAVAQKPVTAQAPIAALDGSVKPMTVAAYLAQLAAPGTTAADGNLQIGKLDVGAVANRLAVELRVARAELHLIAVDAELTDRYRALGRKVPGSLPPTVDPATGRLYLYRPYTDDWNLFSDFGPDNLAAQSNREDDPRMNLKATRQQGLVLR